MNEDVLRDEYILEMKNVTKVFPGVVALDKANLLLKKGEVHALCGENGAGKSTLMKILSGIYKHDKGTITFKDKPFVVHNPHEAIEAGISMIHQELNMVQDMTVEQNLFLGNETLYINSRENLEAAREMLKEVDLDIDPRSRIKWLSVAQQQMVEIAKAISRKADIVIMDEPTSAITEKEVEKLFEIIRKLKAQGTAIIYISHKLDEIFKIADSLTVLRDGKIVGNFQIDQIKKPKMISLMVGRELSDMYQKVDTEKHEVKLEVKGLTCHGKFKDINFYIRRGEVLGFAGLMGAGRTEIMECLFGLRKYDSGEILIDGQPSQIKRPADAIGRKIAFVTEDRKRYGLNLVTSVKKNITIVNLRSCLRRGVLSNALEQKAAKKMIDAFSIKTPSQNTLAQSLSGGNQQKIVLAKWFLSNPDLIILDEPTRGIDIGAKFEIYKLITDFAKQGKACIMVSSELPELMGICDRIMVVSHGEISGEFAYEEYSQESIMYCAMGQEKGDS